MFGISFAELLVVIVVAIVVIGPKDMPEVARYIIRLIMKIKKLIAKTRIELHEIGKELGLDEIKSEVEKELIAEKIKLEKDVTTIIDIYGNEHVIEDIEKVRPDMKKEELTAEVEKYNAINSNKEEVSKY
jgi:sec-independent protein translocase protein TatB